MPPEPTILAFDTSAAHCAAALLSGGRIVASRHEEMKRGQAERLVPLLQEVLAQEGAVWEEIDAIGVGIGPGNFTGIRISVSTARGLALSLGVPALGVTSFEVARGPASIPGPQHQIVTLRGPRSTFYLQRFENGVPAGEPETLDATSPHWLELEISAPEGTELLGPFAEHLMLALGRGAPSMYPWNDGDIDWRRSADIIAHIAAERFASGEPFDRPAPLYIRAPDAAPSRNAAPVLLR
ncbi:MAG: tRNA (adenosine(37)-N6)-threonylcarbamoyltransferase complex dimerization subunit type 1 TsaB [Pseudomonadota bacterium]